MIPALSVLAIDDDADNLRLIQVSLGGLPVELLTATDPEAGLELFARQRPCCVLVDVRMPKLSGMEVLERIVALDPGAEVILMSAYYSTEAAVEAIQKGATDYLEKPLNFEKLRNKINALVAGAQKRQHAFQLDQEIVETFQFHGIVGRSPAMLQLFAVIERVAPHFRAVLIHGETGTGKELVAAALHKLSQGSRFAVCNCSAVTETLAESELFGHVRGAFTGAAQDKAGLFEYADGGTLFLDEVGEMPLSMQAKLLRALENQQIQRVGSPVTRSINVRVIAASNRDLRREVAEKRFREDLYYRLSMITLELPPLRQRKEDLPLLQRYFLQKFSRQYGKRLRGMTRRMQSLLAAHNWPGNVRELENVIGNAAMMTDNELLDLAQLPSYLAKKEDSDNGAADPVLSLEELQMRHIARVLESVGGNKERAAAILKISRGTLYNWLRRIEHERAHAAVRSGGE